MEAGGREGYRMFPTLAVAEEEGKEAFRVWRLLAGDRVPCCP